MPFRRKAQKRFMFATMPTTAREWAHETPNIKGLPQKLTTSDPEFTRKRNPQQAREQPREREPPQKKKSRGSREKASGIQVILKAGTPRTPLTQAGHNGLAAVVRFGEKAAQQAQSRPNLTKTSSTQAVPTREPLAVLSILGGVIHTGRTGETSQKTAELLADSRLRARTVAEARRQGAVADLLKHCCYSDLGGPLEKQALAAAASQPLLPPLAQAQQQMASFLPQRSPQAGQGLLPTGLDAPQAQDAQSQQPAAQGLGHATAVPGMQGSAAANPIDQHGPLDPRGLALDGNHGSGVQKGFKIAAWLKDRQRREKQASEDCVTEFHPTEKLSREELEKSASNGHGKDIWACGHEDYCRCHAGGAIIRRHKTAVCYDCQQQEKQARVEPIPRWRSPAPQGPLNQELLASAGVQRLLASLGCESTDSGGIRDKAGASRCESSHSRQPREKAAASGCESSHSDPLELWRLSELSQRVKLSFRLPWGEDPEEKRRRRQKVTTPKVGIGLGLGAAGAYGLAQGLASDTQANRVTDAANNYNPRAFTHGELPPNQTGLTYYQNTLSPAAQLKPFGQPVGDALVQVRADPDIMEFLGTEGYGLYDAKAREGVLGKGHYQQFAKGPVPAYAHQMKAQFPHTPVPQELGVPEGSRYSDWMGRRLEDFVEKETGQRIHPFEFSTSFMPHEEQKALMERFHASLSPEEQAFRRGLCSPRH